MVKFSRALFEQICDRIAEGESLRAICREPDMPSAKSFMRWLEADTDAAGNDGPLRQRYARAREDSADADADAVKEIAYRALTGEYKPDAARVAIDALKWSAGKRKPKVYGDKVAIGGADDLPAIRQETTITDIELARRIAFTLARAAQEEAGNGNGGS